MGIFDIFKNLNKQDSKTTKKPIKPQPEQNTRKVTFTYNEQKDINTLISELKLPKEIIIPNMDITLGEFKTLHYLSPICKQEFNLPPHLSEFIQDAQNLVYNGYFDNASIAEILNKSKLPELKIFLKENNLPISGKKEILIERIMENIDKSVIIDKFKINQYLSISKKGKALLKKYPRNFLDKCDFLRITKAISKQIDKSLITDNFGFVSEKIDLLNNYSEYDITLKVFILAREKCDNDIDLVTSSYYRRHSDIFYELYNIKIPNNVFMQLENYRHSYKELKKSMDLSDFHKYYTILPAKDQKTCKYCKKFKDEKMLYSEAKIGINYPPFYNCRADFCRCMVIPVLEDSF